MDIVLKKVGRSPFKFEKRLDNVTIKGFLEYDNSNLLKLEAVLIGSEEFCCDRCGNSFDKNIDESLKLYVSDGVFLDKESKNLDVIEALDGTFNIDLFIRSEVELLKNDYNFCQECSGKDFSYEI